MTDNTRLNQGERGQYHDELDPLGRWLDRQEQLLKDAGKNTPKTIISARKKLIKAQTSPAYLGEPVINMVQPFYRPKRLHRSVGLKTMVRIFDHIDHLEQQQREDDAAIIAALTII